MSFRQPKSDKHEADQAWQRWLDQHRRELQAIGLPAEVYLSESHWQDFLENGHLHWHPQDASGFSFDRLPPLAAAALKQFLESQSSDVERVPPLLGWLRVRLSAQ